MTRVIAFLLIFCLGVLLAALIQVVIERWLEQRQAKREGKVVDIRSKVR